MGHFRSGSLTTGTSYGTEDGCKQIVGCLGVGIYSCRKSRSTEMLSETTAAEKCWWYSFLLVFIFIVTFLFCWSVFSNDYDDFNWFIYDNAGLWFGWGVTILSFLVLLSFYTFLLLCSGIALISRGKGKRLHLCHKVSMIAILVICIAGYAAVSQLWNEEFYSVVIALKMIGPWLHIALLFVVVASSWLMWYEVMRIEDYRMWIVASISVFVLFLCVCFIPVFITSPCIGADANSIPKPLIISHRLGDVKHAPENTILAFEEGDERCTSFGVETDVSISWDGVPFLMHDVDNIQRTTNVASVFPDKADQRAEFFTWAELQQLDAGSWFLQKDPFRTAHSLSNELKDKIKNQKIPSLHQVGELLHNYSIIFDLYQPADPHPYRYNFTEIALDALIGSHSVPPDQILWLPSYDRAGIRAMAPGLRIVATRNSTSFFQQNNISVANLGYLEHTAESIENYVKNNISVIQYRIEAPWLFSYAWCQGTSMVTTNSCERLSTIAEPIWTLSKEGYISLWVCLDVFGFACLIAIFFIQYYCSESRFLPFFIDRKNAISTSTVNLSLELE